jgi:hypothetical protein
LSGSPNSSRSSRSSTENPSFSTSAPAAAAASSSGGTLLLHFSASILPPSFTGQPEKQTNTSYVKITNSQHQKAKAARFKKEFFVSVYFLFLSE